jgi:hypothetical protein
LQGMASQVQSGSDYFEDSARGWRLCFVSEPVGVLVGVHRSPWPGVSTTELEQTMSVRPAAIVVSWTSAAIAQVHKRSCPG